MRGLAHVTAAQRSGQHTTQITNILGKMRTICFISSSKPISKQRSASSITSAWRFLYTNPFVLCRDVVQGLGTLHMLPPGNRLACAQWANHAEHAPRRAQTHAITAVCDLIARYGFRRIFCMGPHTYSKTFQSLEFLSRIFCRDPPYISRKISPPGHAKILDYLNVSRWIFSISNTSRPYMSHSKIHNRAIKSAVNLVIQLSTQPHGVLRVNHASLVTDYARWL